jgi:hypothetical protein
MPSKSTHKAARSNASAKSTNKKLRGSKDGSTHTGERKRHLSQDRVAIRLKDIPDLTEQNRQEILDDYLDWEETILKLKNRGYVIIDLKSHHLAANQKMHCELMELKVDGKWQSCVRQGWESGKRFQLADILEDEYKMDNLPSCEELVESAQRIMSRISKLLYGQDQKYEVAYLSRDPGKFKHEFIHADSLFQGDLTGIMPLNDDSVQPSFYPYHKIANGPPIARSDKFFKDQNIRGIYEQMQIRFQGISNTGDGVATVYESLRPTSTVKRGNLILHLGDALHARPAIEMIKQDRWICFEGKLLADVPAASQQTEDDLERGPDQPGKTAGVTPDDDGNKSTEDQNSVLDDAKRPAVNPSPVEPPNPDSHGVVDALVVLKYAPPDVKEGAAIHHLIAAGYKEPHEAAKFHETRYQGADSDRLDKFKARFVELLHKTEKSVKLDESLLPKCFNDFGWK